MQFIDLKAQYARIKDDVEKGIMNVLEHGRYIMGPEIEELEKNLANYAGVKHCVACSSGTDALLMPMMAWNIGPGDAVFTTPFTFIATAEVIKLLGATPVFVDIEKDTFNISSTELEKEIEKVKNDSNLVPKAIIPVDLFGLPADYGEISKIAAKHNLLLLEDAAQSFGGEYKGRKTCSFGNAAATSFFPAKPLGCYGDGGAVLTDDDELYEKLISIRVHGQGTDKYTNVRIGINGRIDSIQAAVLNAKLKIFDNEISGRQRVAKKYNELLKGKLTCQKIPDGCLSAWAQFAVMAKDSSEREKIQQKLKEENIPTAIYYPIPLHLQEAFANLGYSKGDMPISEEISEKIFALPMHPYLKDAEIEFICSKI